MEKNIENKIKLCCEFLGKSNKILEREIQVKICE